jgi:hypothetical protein
MKSKMILSLAVIVAINLISIGVFAQSSRTRTHDDVTSNARGFTMGLVYSNLTDSKSKDESNLYINGVRVDGDSDTQTYGVHAGLYGVNLGFKDLYAFGAWGWDGGLQVLKGLNGSETPQKLVIYKVYGDVAWPMSDVFSLVGGLNISYFDQLHSDVGAVKVEPGLGAQVGIETRVRSLSVLLGAQVLSQTVKNELSGTTETGVPFKQDGQSESTISGFIAQIGYTF